MNDRAHDADPLQGLIAELRSEPRPAEIRDEAATVDAMLSALSPMEAITMTKLPSRATRIAVAVAASVLGVSGLAAAGGGATLPSSSQAPFDQAPPASRPPVETPADLRTATTSTSTTIEGEEDDVTTSLESDTTLVDDPSTAFDETECADGNHGKTVSSVAHSVEPGPDHGPAVAEAAQSSCGKHLEGDDEATEEETEDSTAPDDETSTTADDDDEQDDDADKGESGEIHSSGKSQRPEDAGKPSDDD